MVFNSLDLNPSGIKKIWLKYLEYHFIDTYFDLVRPNEPKPSQPKIELKLGSFD